MPRSPLNTASYGLLETIYSEDNEKKKHWHEYKLLKVPWSLAQSVLMFPMTRVSTNRCIHRAWKTKHHIQSSVSNSFKKKDRFTQKIEKNTAEHKVTYLYACSDLGLKHVHQLRYFHNLFDEEAKRPYRSTTYPKFSSFPKAHNIKKVLFQ